jgi:hypothetical protein
MTIALLFYPILDALGRLAGLPPEAGTPERADAAQTQKWATEFERDLVERTIRDAVTNQLRHGDPSRSPAFGGRDPGPAAG